MCSSIYGVDAGAMWRAAEAAREVEKLPPLIQPGDVILEVIEEQTLANGCVVQIVSVRPARIMQLIIHNFGGEKEQEPAKDPAPAEPPAQEPAKDPSEPKPPEVYASDASSIVPRMKDMFLRKQKDTFLRKQKDTFLRKQSAINFDMVT